MARPGEIIENPATGERIEFLETRETTDGVFLEFELTLAPYGRVGGLPHQHPAQEIVDVLEGARVARTACRARGAAGVPGAAGRGERRHSCCRRCLSSPSGEGGHLCGEPLCIVT